MNEKTFEKLISQGESENFELKPSLSDTDRIVEIVASLANTHGGIVLIGVNSQGKILGITIGNQTIERLTNTITDNTDPVIYPGIYSFEIKGKEIITIKLAFRTLVKKIIELT